MTDKQGKVGDVCGWLDVPDRGLARTKDGSVAYRNRGRGVFVAQPGEPWLGAQPWADEGKWRWGTMSLEETVTIIALDVPADATADDLRELAEVFEVREALRDGAARYSEVPERDPFDVRPRFWRSLVDDEGSLDAAADRLHRAGWKPGMTAEDAARMLADQDGHARKITAEEQAEAQRIIDADLDPGCPDGLGCELCTPQDDE